MLNSVDNHSGGPLLGFMSNTPKASNQDAKTKNSLKPDGLVAAPNTGDISLFKRAEAFVEAIKLATYNRQILKKVKRRLKAHQLRQPHENLGRNKDTEHKWIDNKIRPGAGAGLRQGDFAGSVGGWGLEAKQGTFQNAERPKFAGTSGEWESPPIGGVIGNMDR
jgi:hypothetical protein